MTALRQHIARAAALEEAAKVAERCELFRGDRLINSDPRATIAAAIRALNERQSAVDQLTELQPEMEDKPDGEPF